MDGRSLESEFEEQSHNMSSYGDVRVPPYLHSGLVAVITVLSFLASVILFFAFYHLVLAWKLVNNLKKRSKNATRFEDGEDDVEERGDLTPVERLREDSVLIHDAVFHDSLYDVTQDPKPEPSPAPSIFTEEAFLQEILTSVAETRQERREEENVSLVPDIIDDVIDNILVNSQSSVANTGKIQEEEEGQATEEDAGVLLMRNESYYRAIEDEESLLSPVSFSDCQNNPFLDWSDPQLTTNGGADGGKPKLETCPEKVLRSPLEDSPHLTETREREKAVQYHSTPIIEGQHYSDTSPASIGEFPNYLNLESVARLSYTPVYRTANSFNKSP